MRFTKPLGQSDEVSLPVSKRELHRFARSEPDFNNSTTLPDAEAEVAAWPDSKLSAIGYKVATGRWPQHLIMHFEKAVKAALLARGLAMHPAFLSECCVCKAAGKAGKAIYRVKHNGFCIKHKAYAQMEQNKLARALDTVLAAREKEFSEHERERAAVDKKNSMRTRANRAHRTGRA